MDKINRCSNSIIKALLAGFVIIGSLFMAGDTVYAAEYDDVEITEKIFPTESLRQYITENYDTNKDGKLDYSERCNVKEFVFNGESFDNPGPLRSIGFLKYFPNLEHLECRYQKSFDEGPVLSKLKSLKYLDCTGMNLIGFDISELTSLEYLDCSYNSIMGLDISNNLELKKCICSNTNCKYIITGKNSKLEYLDCSYTLMKVTFDLSQCTGLKYLNCSRCGFEQKKSDLDLSYCTALEYLDCHSSGAFSEFDASKNAELKYLDCSGAIRSLTLNNPKLEYLNCDSDFLRRIDIRNCPLLLEDIENRIVYKGAIIKGGEPTVDEETFPDEKFRQYVLEKIDEDKNGILDWSEIKPVKILKFQGSLDTLGGYKSLEGIDIFTELERLYCSYNELSSLDISNNTKLMILDCSNNKLTELNLSNNKSLGSVYCGFNNLTELDLSNNVGIVTVYCSNNNISKLDLIKNKSLEEFNCEQNQIEELLLGKKEKMKQLNCTNNKLFMIDISECPELLNNVAFRVKADPNVIIVKSEEERKAAEEKKNKENENKNVIKVFVDVIETDWWCHAIQFVYDNSIMNGVSDTSFAPKMTLTREQFITVLYNMEGAPEIKYKQIFDDVKNEASIWYASSVTWAFTNDITSGIGNHLFGTGMEITREQLATLLYNYAQQKEEYKLTIDANAVTNFPDANQISTWATEGMKWAVTNGVMGGKTGKDGHNILDPQGKATRAECAQMIKNLKEKAIK